MIEIDTLRRAGALFVGANPATIADFARQFPARAIPPTGAPYLTRYTVAELKDRAGFTFLHHFHRSDADRELHSHPWKGASLILTGGYREERRTWSSRSGFDIEARVVLPGDVSEVEPDTFHRVDLLDPAGCWTLFIAGGHDHSWGFWNRGTRIFTPFEEFKAARDGHTEGGAA